MNDLLVALSFPPLITDDYTQTDHITATVYVNGSLALRTENGVTGLSPERTRILLAALQAAQS